MRKVIVIPARTKSKRFPRKLMQSVGGKRVIEWAFEWVSKAGYETWVASGDEEILDLFPKNSLPTYGNCCNGTMRVAEAVRALRLEGDDLVINVQGDIAWYDPFVLECVVHQVEEGLASMVTVGHRVIGKDLIGKDNVVVLCSRNGNAVFFTREDIIGCSSLLHVGIYGMKYMNLMRYSGCQSCEWEEMFNLEQMRWLYYGEKIRVWANGGPKPVIIDNPEDLSELEEVWQKTQKK